MSDKRCLNCNGPVSPRNTTGYCEKTKACVAARVKARYRVKSEYAALEVRRCEVCGAELGSRRRTGRFCPEHQNAGKRVKRVERRRACLGGCGRVVSGDNPSDFCKVCKPREAEIRAELERQAEAARREAERQRALAEKAEREARRRAREKAERAERPAGFIPLEDIKNAEERRQVAELRELAEWIHRDRLRRGIPPEGITVAELQRRQAARRGHRTQPAA